MSQSALDDVWHDQLGLIPTPAPEDYAAARRYVARVAPDCLEALDL